MGGLKSAANRLAPYVLVAPAAAVVGFGCLYPTLDAGRLGFYRWSLGAPWSTAEWVGVSGFLDAARDPAVLGSFAVTLVFAFLVVVAEMVAGTLLALALEQPIRGMGLFRTIFISPMMIAPIVVGLVWRYIFDTQFGPANALLRMVGIPAQAWLADPVLAFAAVVVSDVWQWTPFVIIMVLAGLANLDGSAMEAARVDGARPWQIVLRIKLPMLAPVLAITALMRLIDAFRVLEVIYALTFGGPGNSTEVLPLLIYKTAFVGQQLGFSSAISMLLLVVVVGLSAAVLTLSNPMQEARR